MPAKVAIIGSGVFAEAAYLPALSAITKEVTLHTIWSRSQKSAEKLHSAASSLSKDIGLEHGEDGLQRVLDNQEIEGVMIVLPITAQPDMVIRCLEAGKHVLSEKPIGKDIATAKKLVEEYEKRFAPKGLIWRVAESEFRLLGQSGVFRLTVDWVSEPLFTFARDALRQREIGPVLYWNLKMEGYVEDGSKYQATPWRTVPDYQGGMSLPFFLHSIRQRLMSGFLLDGGVHQTALLRAVLPVKPSSIIAHNALHRKLLLPHDTIMGLALPPSSATVEPHGPSTKLSTALNTTGIVENGTSQPQGTILMSFAAPNIPAEGKSGNGLFITCLNGSVNIASLPNGKLSVRVTGAEGSNVKNEYKEERPSGVDVEIAAFGRAITCLKDGVENQEENWGDVRGGLWDISVIQALLTSQGKEVVLEDSIASA